MAARLTPPKERHWHYLWDKAGELRAAAARLVELFGEFEGRPPARPEVVLAAVRHHGRHYRAARLLHPARVELPASEAGSILLSVAGSAGVLASEADLDELRRDPRESPSGRTWRRRRWPASCPRCVAGRCAVLSERPVLHLVTSTGSGDSAVAAPTFRTAEPRPHHGSTPAWTAGQGRFEALELPAGWTVVDLQEEAFALPRGRWDEATAVMVAETLSALPAYAIEWDWTRASACQERPV